MSQDLLFVFTAAKSIESEIAEDLLRVRVPRTVVARHYFRLSVDYGAKVLIAPQDRDRDRAANDL